MKSSPWLPLVLLFVLAACGKGSEMRRIMAEVDQRNQTWQSLAGDTVMADVARYMDSHGTPNERVRAYYLLSGVYRDRGEAPHALDLLHEAVERADTTAADCDFRLLSRVHGQMAALFEEQAMPRSQLEEERIAYRYAMQDHDTIAALAFYGKQASCYYMLGMMDSVLYYSEHACKQYEEYGDTLTANTELSSAVYVCLLRGDYRQAKEYLDRLEYESNIAGQDSFAWKGYYLLYLYKGDYFLGVGKYDSAMLAYRKLVAEGETLHNVMLGNNGLYRLYSQLGIKDSIIKYADLHTCQNDSFVRQLEQSKLVQSEALYNYTRHVKIAEHERTIAASTRRNYQGALLLLAVTMLFGYLYYRQYRSRKLAEIRLLSNDYARVKDEYDQKLHELELMKKDGASQLSAREGEIERLSTQISALEAQVQAVKLSDQFAAIMSTPLVRRLREAAKAKHGVVMPNEADWNALAGLFRQHLPLAYTRLFGSSQLARQEWCTCLLLLLKFSNGEVAVLLNTSPQRITNVKSNANQKLFGDGSASTLEPHLLQIVRKV